MDKNVLVYRKKHGDFTEWPLKWAKEFLHEINIIQSEHQGIKHKIVHTRAFILYF